MQTGSSRVGSSGDVFAPRREIPRTPPRVRQEARVDVGPGPVSKNVATTSTLVEDRENIPPDWSSPSNHRKVQAPCFTPSRSLVRSPPPAGQLKATPKATHSSTANPLPRHHEATPPPAVPASPHVGLPEGLVCTDTDLAFLQRMRNIRHRDQLQKQVVSLDKALRTAAEQKEQLQHQSEKVGSDLQEMKQKYTRTLTDIQSLRLSSRQDEIPAQPKPSCDDVDLLASELSHTHLSQLQHRQKLMAVQVQKTEQDIQREVMKIKQDEQKLHNMREKEGLNVKELDRNLEVAQGEKREWEVKVQKVSEAHQKMERELETLQSELDLTASPATSHSRERDTAAAEERLSLLIKRCDLYVRRHHILKQLRQHQTAHTQ